MTLNQQLYHSHWSNHQPNKDFERWEIIYVCALLYWTYSLWLHHYCRRRCYSRRRRRRRCRRRRRRCRRHRLKCHFLESCWKNDNKVKRIYKDQIFSIRFIQETRLKSRFRCPRFSYFNKECHYKCESKQAKPNLIKSCRFTSSHLPSKYHLAITSYFRA